MDTKSKSLILFLAQAKDRQVASFLKIADLEQIHALKEATLNLLLGNLPIDEEEKGQLKKHKNFLREFARKGSKCDLSRKAKVLKIVLKTATAALKGQ